MGLFKKIALAGLGIGAIAGVTHAMALERTSKELDIITKTMIDSFDLSGMKLRINLVIKNPTRTSLRIKYPFVRLMNGGDEIASSDSNNSTVVIPAFGQATPDPIKISIPIGKLISIGISLFTPNPDGVKVTVVTSTDVLLFAGLFHYHYESKEDIVLKSATHAS